jgi:hypothetical protein
MPSDWLCACHSTVLLANGCMDGPLVHQECPAAGLTDMSQQSPCSRQTAHPMQLSER